MKSQFIAVIDSGIGGISVLTELEKNFPQEQFLYFGDNDNAPYGNRSIQNLLSITLKNIDYILKYNVKAIVLACNTLSVNLKREIEEYSSVPTFAIYPPVEQCMVENGLTLLLATNRTAQNYKSTARFHSVGLETLAERIEKNLHRLNLLTDEELFSGCFDDNLKDKKGCYDTVILGCTHYNFIKKQIFDHFQPQKIADGTQNLIFSLQKFLQSRKSLVKIRRNETLFIGENAKKNFYFYKKSGQEYQKNEFFYKK